MKICSIPGCGKRKTSKGFCQTHYTRYLKYGDPYFKKYSGDGSICLQGYKWKSIKCERGKRKLKKEHVLLAEKALGRRLKNREQIHHINNDRLDNRPDNLVICGNDAYHKLLHQRQRALDNCGYADWRKCPYCKQYDAPKNMYHHQNHYEHRKCAREYHRKWKAR